MRLGLSRGPIRVVLLHMEGAGRHEWHAVSARPSHHRDVRERNRRALLPSVSEIHPPRLGPPAIHSLRSSRLGILGS